MDTGRILRVSWVDTRHRQTHGHGEAGTSEGEAEVIQRQRESMVRENSGGSIVHMAVPPPNALATSRNPPKSAM
jgi:hypothetical protein